MTSSTFTLHTLDTVYSADSVEWCPVEGLQYILACGTYQLADSQDADRKDDAPKKRLGRLLTFSLGCSSIASETILQQHQQQDMPAVLDMKWCHRLRDGGATLAIVNAAGELRLLGLNPDGDVIQCVERHTLAVGEDRLALSLDWSAEVSHSDVSRGVVVSDSKGEVTQVDVNAGAAKVVRQWKAHEYEAWIAAYDCWQADVIYSGGDDSLLKVWDVRRSTEAPVLTSKKHSAGVCSIQSNPCRQYILATGSYDEHILLWDGRQMRRPLAELSAGGGVWRLKWHREKPHLLLASCMHNGFHVFDCASSASGIVANHVGSYMKHESLAYGADWCHLEPNSLPQVDVAEIAIAHRSPQRHDVGNPTESMREAQCGGSAEARSGHQKRAPCVVASCSFYDHSMHIWTIDPLLGGVADELTVHKSAR